MRDGLIFNIIVYLRYFELVSHTKILSYQL